MHLRLTFNSGAAFGLGAGLPSWAVLAGTGLIAVIIAIYAWRRAPDLPVPGRAALVCVVGGAVSNVADRAVDGAVTDYVHGGWLPAFNLADVLVVGGGIVFTLSHPAIRNFREQPARRVSR